MQIIFTSSDIQMPISYEKNVRTLQDTENARENSFLPLHIVIELNITNRSTRSSSSIIAQYQTQGSVLIIILFTLIILSQTTSNACSISTAFNTARGLSESALGALLHILILYYVIYSWQICCRGEGFLWGKSLHANMTTLKMFEYLLSQSSTENNEKKMKM